MDDLAKRVAWAIEIIKTDPTLDPGITDIELANKLGTNKNTLATYRKGQGSLISIVIERLISVYNFNPMWLYKGEGEPYPGARAKYPEVCGPEETISVVNESEEKYDSSEFVFVPQFTSPSSAGTGLIPDQNVEMRVAFRRDWIKRKGDPQSMSLVKVSGDSMDDTLINGDLVLVNHAKNYLDPQGGLYEISIDNFTFIKRLELLAHERKIKVISDNKERYSPFEVEFDQIVINGKVIWYAREIEK